MRALIELSDNPEDGGLHIEAGAQKNGVRDEDSSALAAYDATIDFIRLLGTEHGPELTALVQALSHPEDLEEVTVDGLTGNPDPKRLN